MAPRYQTCSARSSGASLLAAFLIVSEIYPIDNFTGRLYTKDVKRIKLPEKVKRFLFPGGLVFAALLIAGGFYFWKRGLDLVSKDLFLQEEEEGEVSGARTAVPQNFPTDTPLFEGAEILSSLESKERIQVTLQTEATTQRVRKFYQQEMGGLGWKLTGRGMANDNGVLTFKKGERGAQIVITSDDPAGPTLIILSATP